MLLALGVAGIDEGEKYAGDPVTLEGVGGRGGEGWGCCCWDNEAISERGALGRRIAPSCGGD